MKDFFKTPGGTELPIMLVKGKPYMQVVYRIIWFREVFSHGSIKSEIIQHTDTFAICKAQIWDGNGALLAEAHKKEDKQGFGDYLEKAETGAKGRALADCGFGTQFALTDYDEEHRIVDSPNPPARKAYGPEHREPAPHHQSPSGKDNGARSKTPLSPSHEPTSKKIDPHPKIQTEHPKELKNSAPASSGDVANLLANLESLKKNTPEFYTWLDGKYGTRFLNSLKKWQIDEIMQLITKEKK